MKQSKYIKGKTMVSLFRSSIFNFLSQITIFLSATLLSIILARALGPSLMGEYSYYMWLISTLSIILTLGLPRTIMRFIAQSKSTLQDQIISRTIIFQTKVASICLLISLTWILLFGGDQKLTLFIVALTLCASALNLLITSILSGLQKFNLLFKINLLTSPLLMIISILVLLYNSNLVNLLIANLLAVSLSLIVCLYYLKKHLNFNLKPLSEKLYKEIKVPAVSISLIVFLDLILMERSEVFFLKNYSTIEQVAFYSISFGLVSRVMTLVPGAVAGVIMPKVAILHGKSETQKIKQTYFSSTRYLILISLPIILAGISLVSLLISILYGSGYAAVVPVIQILLISGGLSAVVAAAAAVLYGTGGQSFILKLAAIAAVINIILDMVFIPSYGAIGAAAANAIAQIIGVVSGTYYLIKYKNMVFPWKDTLKVLIAASVSAAQVYYLKIFFNGGNQVVFLLWLSALFVLTYVLILYLLKTFIKQDYDLLKRITDRMGLKI
jgi:O-antigen/teichoic acid export membrane protein